MEKNELVLPKVEPGQPLSAIVAAGYHETGQSQIINNLAMSIRAASLRIDMFNVADEYYALEQPSVIFKINSNVGKMKKTAQYLFECTQIIAFREQRRNIPYGISLKDYMSMRGFTSEDAARRQLGKDITALSGATFTIKEVRKKKGGDFIFYPIFRSIGYKRGTFVFQYSEEFLKILNRFSPMPLHPNLLKTDPNKNPYLLGLGRKIYELMELAAKRQKKQVKVTIYDLLKAGCFPTADQAGRRYNEYVRKPFERDMDTLVTIKSIKSWAYNITPPKKPYDYEAATVTITAPDYPWAAIQDRINREQKEEQETDRVPDKTDRVPDKTDRVPDKIYVSP